MLLEQAHMKPRPYRSMYNSSTTLQRIFKNHPSPNRVQRPPARDLLASDPSRPCHPLFYRPSQSPERGQNPTHQKVSECMQQMRRSCKHLFLPSFNPLEENLQIDEPSCFFVQNEFLWAKHRPAALASQTLCYMHPVDQHSPSKSDFYLMLDLNRCLLLTSGKQLNRLLQDGTF